MRYALAALLVLASCSGTQRPVTWDVAALASVHGAAHALALVDDGAAAYYRVRSDAIAADGGIDGGSVRGADYIAATAALDHGYAALVRDLSVTRDGLVLAESLVRQASAFADAPSRCRAFVALDALTDDLQLVGADAVALGVPIDANLLAAAHDLDGIALGLAAGCLDAGASGLD